MLTYLPCLSRARYKNLHVEVVMSFKSLMGIGTALGLASACATTAVPQERLTAAAGSIRAAEEVGADKVPAAALHLQLAREEAEQARELIKKKENLRADYVLQRAEADADLALSLAKEAPLRSEAQDAINKLQILKQKNAQ